MYSTASKEGVTYAVAYIDYPAGTIPAGAQTYLTSMDSIMATSMNGTLVDSSDATLGGRQARQLTIAAKSGVTINLGLTFKGDRLYMLMVIDPAGLDAYPLHFGSTFTIK